MRAPSDGRLGEAASGESDDRARYGPFTDAKTEELRAAHDVLARFYADLWLTRWTACPAGPSI